MNRQRLRIDWSTIKEQLARNNRALNSSLHASRERVDAEFRKRAAQLAARRSDAHPGRHSHSQQKARKAMVFALGRERYALELEKILGVRPFEDCTPVPSAPPQVRGIIHLHGELRTVVDLRLLLDLPAAETVPRGYILRVRKGGGEIGFLVDEVAQVCDIDPSEFAQPAAPRADSQARCVMGIAADGLILLDIETLFTLPLFAEETH